MDISKHNTRQLETLLVIMRALRDLDNGCPWDIKQTFKSITPYTIEEAYEVADAIERKDMPGLCDELGDLLLQVAFHAQIASETDLFSFDDVINSICTKMIRRHPHVFGNKEQRAKIPQKGFWEDIKATEKPVNSTAKQHESILDSVPVTLPALSRANKLQAKAARVGFDWPTIEGVYAKLDEEITELKQAASADDHAKIGEELGDLMFTLVNLTRHFSHDPEQILRKANSKFQNRFNYMEAESDVSLKELDLKGLETLWQRAKSGMR